LKNIVRKSLTFSITFFSLVNFMSCTLLAPVDRSRYSDLEGHIFSLNTNAPVSNAEIKVLEPSATEKTDRNGKFFIRALPVNWVNVEINVPGYQPLVRKVKIEPYGTKYIDFWISKNNNSIESDKIAFERNGDIWLTDEYGINQVNLTEKLKEKSLYSNISASYSYNSPVWFSDKSKLAYIVIDNSVDKNTKNGLWVMSPNGKMTQRITYVDSEASGLSISNNGSNFVFSMINPDNASSIGVYKYNKILNKTESLSGNIAKDKAPRLSPEGNMIAYTSNITENPVMTTYDTNQYASSRAQIFIMNINGFNRKQLTQSGENFDPAWSPDGQKIAFISNRSGSTELWVMNKDGSGQRRLTETDATRAGNPTWSSDGQRILFNTNFQQKYSSLEPEEAWIYEPSTYAMHMVSNDAQHPDW
jgi:hypothetical protein